MPVITILAAGKPGRDRCADKGQPLQNLADVLGGCAARPNPGMNPPFLRMLSASSVGLKTIPM